MKLKVLSYSERYDAHKCRLPDGTERFVDLQVDKTLPLSNEELIGRAAEVDHIDGFLYVASNVRVLDE